MDPIVIGLIGTAIGYVGGHLHAKIGSSSCMYGLCSISNVDLDFDKDATVDADKKQ